MILLQYSEKHLTVTRRISNNFLSQEPKRILKFSISRGQAKDVTSLNF